MNAYAFRMLIPMLTTPAPQQWPEALRPPEGDGVRPPEPAVVEAGEGAAHRLRELDVLSQQLDESPTFHAPPRGRIVEQAKGPNRAQRRARR